MGATEKQEDAGVLGGAGARARHGPTPPSREHRATHKTHRVSPTVAGATERQEIGLAVRVQGLIPLATSSHSYLIVEIFFCFPLLLAFVLPLLGCLLPRHGALIGFVSSTAGHV